MPEPPPNDEPANGHANHVDDTAASVPYRKEVRKVANGIYGAVNSGAAGSTAGAASESTPLIAGATQPQPASHSAHHSFIHRLLLDRHHTPGYDSPNRATRSLAHILNITKATLFSSPVNVLLFFVPLGIVAGALEWSAAAVFTLNFFAIIPLAAVLSFATEEISVRLGESLGGLLNATFGNAVELIVSIVALRQGQIEVVQASMLGSILSNLLLVLGMCFLLGGIWNMRDRDNQPMEQSFATVTAQTSCSLMALSCASLIIPASVSIVLIVLARSVCSCKT